MNTTALADRLRAKYPAPPPAQPEPTGSIKIVANDVECFMWQGTYADAINLQKRWLDESFLIYANSAGSAAKRAAGYLMTYGMPEPGDDDLRPSHAGEKWTLAEVGVYKRAVLWLALREHVPGEPGKRLEDVFVGEEITVWFNGDRDELLAQTKAEAEGKANLTDTDRPSLTGAGEFTMTVGITTGCKPRRNWPDAYTMNLAEFFALAGKPNPPPEISSDLVYMPLWPETEEQAHELLAVNGILIFVDTINPGSGVKTCIGFTNRELQQGKPAVVVGRENKA
jgi:hypothetical protein